MGRFAGKDIYTTQESERLIRLPLYYQMSQSDVMHIIDSIYLFYGNGDRSNIWNKYPNLVIRYRSVCEADADVDDDPL